MLGVYNCIVGVCIIYIALLGCVLAILYRGVFTIYIALWGVISIYCIVGVCTIIF